MTFGGFDLLHLGHINLLKQAKELCDRLIVCVSTDEYLEDHKKAKPLLSYFNRVHLVRLTGYADVITPQDFMGKPRLIEKYKPDVLFVGDDWDKETFEGEGLCKVVYLKHTSGISTSWYRKKLRSS